MNDVKYIGLDVHQATISAAVLDSAGKLVMEAILETKDLSGCSGRKLGALESYFVIFFASVLSLAQRFFVAFPIFALAAAESTRLVPVVTFLSADRPIASAAALMPFSLCWSDATCFSSLRSSRLIAARM